MNTVSQRCFSSTPKIGSLTPEKVLEYISHLNTPVLSAVTNLREDIYVDKNAEASNREFIHFERTILTYP